jgi:hypothetical protein
MFTKSITIITTVIIAIMLSSCSIFKPKPTEQLNSWFDVQRKYADVLDKNIGTGELYKVVPIVGPIYSIGTPITPGTSSPITNLCTINKKDLIKTDFSPLPITKEERTFDLNLQMADALKKALNGLADLGLKIESIKSMELSYADLSQVIAAEDAIQNALSNTRCLNAVKGHKIAFIRGEIRGSMKAISDSNLDVDPTVKIKNIGDFTVKYNDKGSFNLEDSKSDRPRFFVVSEINVTTEILKGGGGENTEVPVLKISSPSQETINGLIANTP